MNKIGARLASLAPILLLLLSCTHSREAEPDLINDQFPEAQAELREVLQAIADDAMTANIEGLQAIHLKSDKFTKFGPRRFDRQDVASTDESEAAFFSSVEDLTVEVKDLRIDVFGDVAVATYYPHVTFVRDGEETETSGRQTLVFLRTPDGWKIVHEHGTPKKESGSTPEAGDLAQAQP
jgi:ketosteroid isomerase-like protein